jgi:hypothetical protein
MSNFRLKIATLASCLTALALTVEAAPPQMRTVVAVDEVSSDTLQLPDAVSGQASITYCQACNGTMLSLTSATAYVVANKPVSYALFRSAVRGSGSRLVLVYHSVDTRQVSKIVLTGK